MQKTWEGATVDDDLGLDVIPSHDVAHGPERGADDGLLVVHKELHDPPAHAAVNHRLDLVVGPVAEVGEGPTRIGQDVAVIVKQKSG